MTTGMTLASVVSVSPTPARTTVMLALTVLVVDVDIAQALVFITPVVLWFSGYSKTDYESISSAPSSGN